jgi:hypothetical protein
MMLISPARDAGQEFLFPADLEHYSTTFESPPPKENTMRRLLFVAVLCGSGLASAQDKVDDRMENQQRRIGEGVENGSLTPRETTHLENQEAHLQQRVHEERAANGGHLTAAERQQVNHRQNQLSREIYNKKHNARHE